MQGPDRARQFLRVQADDSSIVIQRRAEFPGAAFEEPSAPGGDAQMADVAGACRCDVLDEPGLEQITEDAADGGLRDAQRSGELTSCDAWVLGDDDESGVAVVGQSVGAESLLGPAVEREYQIVQLVREIHGSILST